MIETMGMLVFVCEREVCVCVCERERERVRERERAEKKLRQMRNQIALK